MKLSKKEKRRVRRILKRSDRRIEFEAAQYRACFAKTELAQTESAVLQNVIIPGPYVGLDKVDQSLIAAFIKEVGQHGVKEAV